MQENTLEEDFNDKTLSVNQSLQIGRETRRHSYCNAAGWTPLRRPRSMGKTLMSETTEPSYVCFLDGV